MSDTSNADHSAHSCESGNPEAECTAVPANWVPAFAGTQRDDSVRFRWRIALLVVCLGCLSALGAGAWWIATLGPAPLGKEIAFSTRVVDRDGRLLRAYANPEGRWRLARERGRCRSALLRHVVCV